MCETQSVASCACGANFDVYALEKAITHITTDSSTAHRWVYVDPTVQDRIGNHLVYPNKPRTLHCY